MVSRIPRLALSTLILIVAALPQLASAQWAPGGVPVFQPPGFAGNPLVVADPQGSFIVWGDDRNASTTDWDVYVQRLTALGTIASGWPIGGLSVCNLPRYQYREGAISDGSGGVIVAWIDYRVDTTVNIYVQRIQGNGSLAPGWTVNGVAVSHAIGFQDKLSMVGDGSGGAFIAWEDQRDWSTRRTDIYAQHILADGSIASGWPADGMPVCVDPAEQSMPSLIADGAGGFLVAWAGVRYGLRTSFAQHILADGSIAPGWAVNGNQISPVGRVMFGLAPNGAGDFYMVTATLHPVYPGYADIYVERLTFDGLPLSGWTLDGFKVCGASDFRSIPSIVSDRSGGAFVSWFDYRPWASGVYASRVLANCSLAGGWTVDGTVVTLRGDQGTGNNALVADGLGGVYIESNEYDNTTGTHAFFFHLLGNAQVAPGWQPDGDPVAGHNEEGDASMGADRQGGLVVSWSESPCCGGRSGVWAQYFYTDGPVPVELSLVNMEVKDGAVMLDWYAAGATGLNPSIERRTPSSYWAALGTPTVDGAGHIRYEDRAVTPGGHYGYRLSCTEDGAQHYSAETWIDVPLPKLALEGARPNPAVRLMNVALSLPDQSPATLAVVDVAGRAVASREVGSLGAGHHLFPIDLGDRTPPGVYWLRLSQGGKTLLAKAAIVR